MYVRFKFYKIKLLEIVEYKHKVNQPSQGLTLLQIV